MLQHYRNSDGADVPELRRMLAERMFDDAASDLGLRFWRLQWIEPCASSEADWTWGPNAPNPVVGFCPNEGDAILLSTKVLAFDIRRIVRHEARHAWHVQRARTHERPNPEDEEDDCDEFAARDE